jgi:hypothetical protein
MMDATSLIISVLALVVSIVGTHWANNRAREANRKAD